MRGYLRPNIDAVPGRMTRDVLRAIDTYLRDLQAQLSTTTARAESGADSGVVTGISEDGNTKAVGDINLVSGSDISITKSGNDFTVTNSSPGVTDHGALTGLADDDHTQYLLADGTRNITGDLTFSTTSVGPVLVVNDGAVDRTYRITLSWNATTSRPSLRLVEVV